MDTVESKDQPSFLSSKIHRDGIISRRLRELEPALPSSTAAPRDFTPPQAPRLSQSEFEARYVNYKLLELDPESHLQAVVAINTTRLEEELTQIKGNIALTPEAQAAVRLFVTAQTAGIPDRRKFDQALREIKGLARFENGWEVRINPSIVEGILGVTGLSLLADIKAGNIEALSPESASDRWRQAGLPGEPISSMGREGQVDPEKLATQIVFVAAHPQIADQWADASLEKRERFLREARILEKPDQSKLKLSLRERLLGPGGSKLPKKTTKILVDGLDAIAEKTALEGKSGKTCEQEVARMQAAIAAAAYQRAKDRAGI